MQYMLLIYDNPADYTGDNAAVMADIMAGHMKLGADLHAAGIQFSGNQLRPTDTATTVRTANGAQTLHDGPYAETHEQLGGYYLIDAPDLDAAIAWAKRIPAAARGAVEVRPIVQR